MKTTQTDDLEVVAMAKANGSRAVTTTHFKDKTLQIDIALPSHIDEDELALLAVEITDVLLQRGFR